MKNSIHYLCKYYYFKYNYINSSEKGDQNYMGKYYGNTYARFGPWIVGIILGYFVYNRNEYTSFNNVSIYYLSLNIY